MQAEKYVMMSKFPDKNCTGTPKTLTIESNACITKKQACERGIDPDCKDFQTNPNSPVWKLVATKYSCVAGKLNISVYQDGICQTPFIEIPAPTNACGEGVSNKLSQKSKSFFLPKIILIDSIYMLR